MLFIVKSISAANAAAVAPAVTALRETFTVEFHALRLLAGALGLWNA